MFNLFWNQFGNLDLKPMNDIAAAGWKLKLILKLGKEKK